MAAIPATTTPEPHRDCDLCPRLVEYRERNARAEPSWFNGAVQSWGDTDATLLIVGLAPGRGGANRTGRPFTGDYAGDLLYATLVKFGLAAGTYGARPDDALSLRDTMITNAVRCAPPENKPTGAEIKACRAFLIARILAMPRLRRIVTLGRIAHESTLRALGERLKDHPFAHGAQSMAAGPNGPLTIAPSYHCSRYNTNTGRLTPAMFEAVFAALDPSAQV
ncbi:MAG: uracil-DNA glycosylase [Pseudomonadota bacterium]